MTQMSVDEAIAHLTRRLTGPDAEALDLVVARLRLHERTATTGGPAAPFTNTWRNRALPGGRHHDYRELR